jgi:hypothetical protein
MMLESDWCRLPNHQSHSVESFNQFTKHGFTLGFRCQVSGVSKHMTERRKQRNFCLLSSVFGSAEPFGPELTAEARRRLDVVSYFFLTPDTRNLKPY